MTAAKRRLAMASMGQPETKVGDLCKELGVTRQTLYRHVSPKEELRSDGALTTWSCGRRRIAQVLLRLQCRIAPRRQVPTLM